MLPLVELSVMEIFTSRSVVSVGSRPTHLVEVFNESVVEFSP